jgi:HK97 family phage prohead protease
VADTHPGNAERLHEYWVHGEGAAQIRWGTEGAHTRCHRLLMEHAHMTSEQAWGYCQLAGHAATGKYSGEDKSKGHHGRTGRVTTYTRSFPLEDIKIRAGGDGRTVEAYAAIFDSPTPIHDEDGTYEEVIDPAAFDRAIEHARRADGWSIPVLFNHGLSAWKTPSDRYSMPIGVPEEIRADRRGLFTRTRYHDTPLAHEVLETIREGSIRAYSFQGAFTRSQPIVPRGLFKPDRDGSLRTVRRLESTLREYGPTPFPAYAGAEVIGVRAESLAAQILIMDAGERQRLATLLASGTPLDPPDDDTATTEEAAVRAEDPPPQRHSGRPPHLELQAQRAKFLIKHGGGRIGA